MKTIQEDAVFPLVVQTYGETLVQPGMTLRDYLAGQALVGLCANPSNTDHAGTMAERAYKHADAMLKERQP